MNAAQANVERVQALQQYKRLNAPFAGIVTARNTDLGALINVGMTPGSELFVVSDVSRLRVYVNVPQRMVGGIQPGTSAQLHVPERPGKNYSASVQSLAQAIDAESGAMRVQLSVDNAAGELLPGAYATVQFNADSGQTDLGLPFSALIIGKQGVQVATLDGEGKARLKPVTIARDLGNIVALADGLSESDRVIDSPPDGIAEGEPLRAAEPKP
ncbi:efflux RND transporter periplasmic adaptor subunit [Pseudomonas asiatica]|uniref:efflux RND transporter periplasmic adaptor subunit n=1 Tax=Pseudomonas asiatica TaxID=2219225 RepID=UPI003B926DA3